jgi:uracil-DNA glycosylase
LLQHLPRLQLTLVLVQYAQAWHCRRDGLSLTERVKGWRHDLPHMLPLPHSSPRNNRWLKQNPWFATSVLPQLQARVDKLLQQPGRQTRND